MYPFDQNRQHVYEQYAYAHDTGDYSRVDPNEARGILQHFMQSAPPEMVQGLLQQYFEQMPAELRVPFAQLLPSPYGINPNHPRQIAQQFHYLSQQQPEWLDQSFRQDAPFGNPFFRAVVVGVAALVAKDFLSSQHESGFGNLLGGMFGGGQSYEYREGGRRGGLGNIIGEFLGDERHSRSREYDGDDGGRGYRKYRRRHDDDDDDD